MPHDKENCVFCDRIWGVAGIAMGLLITLIGFDLLSGGLIARMIGTPASVEDQVNEEIQLADDESAE